jgi:hypothetical protein
MPLLEHFRPPLSMTHPWKGFHSAWANAITIGLNEVLPEGYYAIPEVPLGDQIEIDGATLEGVAVHVFQDQGGPQLRAAIELVSPANKDRPRSRLTFAAKCAGHLEQGVAVVVLDTVTGRRANLHAEIAQTLEAGDGLAWDSPTHLYAVAYRSVSRQGQTQVEAWPEALAVGEQLPVLPLWIGVDLSLPLPLETSYAAACRALRIAMT